MLSVQQSWQHFSVLVFVLMIQPPRKNNRKSERKVNSLPSIFVRSFFLMNEIIGGFHN